MDAALEFHAKGQCADAGRLAEEAAAAVRAPGAPVLWPEGEPPLVYLTRTGKHATALELLQLGLHERCGGADAVGHNGASALHHGAAAAAPALVAELLARGASPARRTQDDHHAGLPGGRTPLHAAAAAAATPCIDLLLSAAPALAAVSDWEGRLPAELAWLAGDQPLALRLADAAIAALDAGADESAGAREGVEEKLECVREAEADASDKQLARTLRKVELRERRREALSVSGRALLRNVHRLVRAFTPDQCAQVVAAARDAAARHGWSTGRHRHCARSCRPLPSPPPPDRWLQPPAPRPRASHVPELMGGGLLSAGAQMRRPMSRSGVCPPSPRGCMRYSPKKFCRR